MLLETFHQATFLDLFYFSGDRPIMIADDQALKLLQEITYWQITKYFNLTNIRSNAIAKNGMTIVIPTQNQN